MYDVEEDVWMVCVCLGDATTLFSSIVPFVAYDVRCMTLGADPILTVLPLVIYDVFTTLVPDEMLLWCTMKFCLSVDDA